MGCASSPRSAYVQFSNRVVVHWANQARQEYYNGVKYAEAAEDRTDLSLGIQCEASFHSEDLGRDSEGEEAVEINQQNEEELINQPNEEELIGLMESFHVTGGGEKNKRQPQEG